MVSRGDLARQVESGHDVPRPTDSSPRGARRRPAAMSAGHALRVAGWLGLALAIGFATVWAFLAYLSPDRVLDFASLMQMCGIPLSR